MIKLVADHHRDLAALCKTYEVRQLELFGSAARGDFDEAKSDLDFLVLFHRNTAADSAERYFGLVAALENLFLRKVDLVDVRAHRNPYFMAEALRHREMLYVS